MSSEQYKRNYRAGWPATSSVWTLLTAVAASAALASHVLMWVPPLASPEMSWWYKFCASFFLILCAPRKGRRPVRSNLTAGFPHYCTCTSILQLWWIQAKHTIAVSQCIMIYVMLLTMSYFWYVIQDIGDGALGRGNNAGGSGMRWHNKKLQAGAQRYYLQVLIPPLFAIYIKSKTVSSHAIVQND